MLSVFDIPDLTKEQFQKFAKLVYEHSQIHLKEHKIVLLSNRLRKRLHALELTSFDAYYNYLIKHEEEMVHFLDAVTTNETYFWRTQRNFALLKKYVLPELLRRFPNTELQFWSAGCSSGEEPYNLAMELVEGMKTNGLFSFHIRASDLSEDMIRQAKEGCYKGRKIEQVPPAALRRYFRENPEAPGCYLVRDDIKKRIDFYAENLFTCEVPKFHCIFCRNVMIYFNREDQAKLVDRFYQSLHPGGFLIIGHSESLHMFSTPFQSRHFEEGLVYYKPEDAK